MNFNSLKNNNQLQKDVSIPKVYIKTYGCQMNVYDSDKMFDLMHVAGYQKSDELAEADLIILNTCHIREKAAEKVYSELGRIKAIKLKNKNKLIAVAGCVSQAEGDQIFKRAPFVDIVVGPQSYHHLPRLVAEANRKKISSHKSVRLINLDFVEEEKFDKLPEETYKHEISKFISVQEGCDKFCTFCVVPYTRGSEFSRPTEHVYREVLIAVNNGAKEITLLGQNVTAYHGKINNTEEVNLAYLIKKIAQIKDLERIRYTTSHPIDIDDDIIDLHGQEKKLMPFLHLPVQSGSNRVLKMMNRKYSRERYLEIINKFRQKKPNIVFSSDFIVGFPGETDEDFEETLDLIDKVNYQGQCYSFKYSSRPGTPAALHDNIPEKMKTERLTKLQEKLRDQQLKFNETCIGETLEILFDKTGKFAGQIMGKSPYMQSVYIKHHDDNKLNKALVRITKAHLNSLEGELI